MSITPYKDAEVDGIECRICHSKTSSELIRSPCLCKGSMGCVHVDCLEQWLNASRHTYCELCSYRFEVTHARRYSLCQSIIVWLQRDQGTLYKLLFFLILSTIKLALIGWMWFLWILSMPQHLATVERSTNNKGNVDARNERANNFDKEMSTAKWMIVCIFLSLLTVLCAKSMCVGSYRVMREQYTAWYQWWNNAVNIHLVLDLQNCKVTPKPQELDDFPIKRDNQTKLKYDPEDDKKHDNDEEQSDLEEVKIGLTVVESGDDVKSIYQNTNVQTKIHKLI